MGAPNIADYLPSNSYLDTRSYSGPPELVAHMLEILEDPVAYSALHHWRTQSSLDWPWMKSAEAVHTPCSLIERQYRLQCGGSTGG